MNPTDEHAPHAANLADRLRALYHESFVRDGAALIAALARQDMQETAHYAHRIKGAAQMAQADTLAALADRIEQTARQGHATLVPAMQAMTESLQDEITRWFDAAHGG